MSRRTISIILVVTAAFLVLLLLPNPKRSIPGRLIRFAAGKPGAVQVAEDLAEDAIRKPGLANLQQWSADILTRYTSGKVVTNGKASYWSMGTVKLASIEVPAGVTNAWSEAPEVSVRLSATGQPECVVLAWYLSGLAVGPTQYALSFQPWCSKSAKPGLYAYSLYK